MKSGIEIFSTESLGKEGGLAPAGRPTLNPKDTGNTDSNHLIRGASVCFSPEVPRCFVVWSVTLKLEGMNSLVSGERKA
jgi:hypothetical protein